MNLELPVLEEAARNRSTVKRNFHLAFAGSFTYCTEFNQPVPYSGLTAVISLPFFPGLGNDCDEGNYPSKIK